MVPSFETKMELQTVACVDSVSPTLSTTRRERNFPTLDLSGLDTSMTSVEASSSDQPILIIQSPKTPTLSRKLKAVSLDSEPARAENGLEIGRDVSSMPNTPKKQIKPRSSLDLDVARPLLAPSSAGLGSNLKRFASNSSISGSQTLKTLPEVMTLQDFSDSRPEPVRIKAKGLLERRGSNASLTIDLGSNSSISEKKGVSVALPAAVPGLRLNTVKSASHINLTWLSSTTSEKCSCSFKATCDSDSSSFVSAPKRNEREPLRRGSSCKNRCYTFHKKCNCLCNFKCRRKSLSNENLYVPPCGVCQQSKLPQNCEADAAVVTLNCKGCRKAVYPRQPNLELDQMLSEDFKLHLQNIQYLQTAGSILSISDLKTSCQPQRVPKLHQEFWEVPLNLQEKCLVSGSQSKNRYKGVLPNEHSRVRLSNPDKYIHANYIKGHEYTETAYIATQGPMEHTCVDFWDMVWSSECNCIIMLTGLIEKGKSKCELYFPLGKRSSPSPDEKSYFYVTTTTRIQDKFNFDLKNATQQFKEEIIAFEELDTIAFGDYEVFFEGSEVLGECAVRHLLLRKMGESETRAVRHYWFSDWQDHKMANPEQVLQIAMSVMDVCGANAAGPAHSTSPIDEGGQVRPARRHRLSNASAGGGVAPKVPVVVHCSAGIGRTGCFLAILNGIRQLRNNFNVDVLAILCSLRLNRGGMVQTAEQYELIHRVLSLYTGTMLD